MRELRVGYAYDHGPIRRNVLGAAPYCRYVRIGDWYRTLTRTGRLLNRCARRELVEVHDLAHQFRERPVHADVSLVHLFNQISYGTLPWLSSFETVLPRLRGLLDAHHGTEPSFARARARARMARAVAALAGNGCRRLLALSQCAADMQRELLAEAPAPDERALGALAAPGPRWRELIARKISVLHPPQAALLSDVGTKPTASGRRVRLLFVGASFFRKGGVELVETLAPLVRAGSAAVELTIVSSLDIDGYAAGETLADQQRARALLAANRDWIRHYERLDHDALLQLMRRCDVGVLPTYADSYGYAVLEFQAAGCPVISTDVRALPEINDDDRGWLIRVPKNRLGEALYATAAERQRLSQAIRQGLTRCLREISSAPGSVRAKAERALRAVQQRHDPTRIGERLFDIYLECATMRAAGSSASHTLSS